MVDEAPLFFAGLRSDDGLGRNSPIRHQICINDWRMLRVTGKGEGCETNIDLCRGASVLGGVCSARDGGFDRPIPQWSLAEVFLSRSRHRRIRMCLLRRGKCRENQVFLDPPPWTLDLAAPAVLKITDAFLKGDSFAVYDFSILKLTTPSVDLLQYNGSDCGTDPEYCYGAAGVSYGTFDLAAGPHSLTIQVADSPYNQGAAYFRIDRIIGAPEPLSIMLLGFGLLGLGAIRRSKN